MNVILFPFMSKGHTIPLLNLARLLLRRGITVTIFTTPANQPFIFKVLSDTSASIIVISFPQNVPDIPTGIESTDMLPSTSLFPSFALATKLMQPEFEKALESIQPVNFMVSDLFLWWTVESAKKFGFPRLVFSGMCNYAVCLSRGVAEEGLFSNVESDHKLVKMIRFPWISVSKIEFEEDYKGPEKGLVLEFKMKAIAALKSSDGYVVNSFYDLEPVFVDYSNGRGEPKSWCVGPLCLAEPPRTSPDQKPTWLEWLDEKLEQKKSVLYVAFGSQVQIPSDQLKEIATGLEKANVSFLWVIRNKESELGHGFEERVKDRGVVVRDWVDQRVILEHPIVQGFLSHCGWNSVIESICAGVPILAWPMMAEQPINARMVAHEIKVGLRVDWPVRRFVKGEVLEQKVKELMEGEIGKEVRKKVKEYAELARKAMEEGTGSSWQTLDMLIDEILKS